MIPSSSDTEALPVRRCFSSVLSASIEVCIRRSVSFLISLIVGIVRLLRGADLRIGWGAGASGRETASIDGAPGRVTQDDAANVTWDEEVEDPDREPVLAAEGDGGRVHHAELPLEDLLVGDVRKQLGARILLRVRGVDPVDAGRLQDRVRPDLARRESGRSVGGEKRASCTAREDDDTLLLQVADRPPPQERLGDR